VSVSTQSDTLSQTHDDYFAVSQCWNSHNVLLYISAKTNRSISRTLAYDKTIYVKLNVSWLSAQINS